MITKQEIVQYIGFLFTAGLFLLLSLAMVWLTGPIEDIESYLSTMLFWGGHLLFAISAIFILILIVAGLLRFWTWLSSGDKK